MQQQIPESLIQSFQRNKVVIFVGSGASVDASLPSWVSLLELLARCISMGTRSSASFVRRHLEEGHFLDVADYIRSTLSPSELFSTLESALQPSNQKPGRIHRAIVSLPAAGIVTTNYDCLLEAADENQGFGPPFTWMDRALALRVGKPFLFKAHGSIHEPDSIILAGADYDRIQDSNEQYNAFLTTVLAPPYQCLFIGYGFRDPDLGLLLRQIDRNWNSWNNPPLALFPVPDPLQPDPILDVMLRKRLHVRPIYTLASSDQGKAVCEWIEALKSRLEPAETLGAKFELPASMRHLLAEFFRVHFHETKEIVSRFAENADGLNRPEDLVVCLQSIGKGSLRRLSRELLSRWPTEPVLKNFAVFVPPSQDGALR